MGWIKVTPETMPPDREMVLVTAIDFYGQKWVETDVRWNEKEKRWQHFHSDGFWVTLLCDKVTHWMPYPEPAED